MLHYATPIFITEALCLVANVKLIINKNSSYYEINSYHIVTLVYVLWQTFTMNLLQIKRTPSFVKVRRMMSGFLSRGIMSFSSDLCPRGQTYTMHTLCRLQQFQRNQHMYAFLGIMCPFRNISSITIIVKDKDSL